LTGLAGLIARVVRDAEDDRWRAILDVWDSTIHGASSSRDGRFDLQSRIDDLAARSAQTELGVDAVRWALRALALVPSYRRRVFALDRDLNNAERSPLLFLPYLLSVETRDHLRPFSDEQLASILSTRNLRAFVRRRKRETESLISSAR
jgi:hypothetical protein